MDTFQIKILLGLSFRCCDCWVPFWRVVADSDRKIYRSNEMKMPARVVVNVSLLW